MVTSGIAADIAALLSSTSARTLTVGIDKSGRILQHDRSAGEVLSGGTGSLLGLELGSLVTGSAYGNGLQSLIDAACSDREGTAVLTIKTINGHHADAVVTVQPLRSADPRLVAQVVLRIAPPSEERFLDPAVMRHALLDGAFSRTGGALDIDQMAPALVNIIVPHFCNSAGLVVLESLVGADEFPSDTPGGLHLVRRLAVAHDNDDPGWDATFPVGEILSYPPDGPHTRCLDTGKPIMLDFSSELAEEFARGMRRKPIAALLSGTSLLLLPLVARGTTLGFFACTRFRGYRRFDAYDTEIGMEFASRAAIFIDNARRYSRERATALTLQRSLLPTGLTAPSSVEVRHRYLPGSKMIEVGGDWYESIALPGGRVALVVGDVAGHGVCAPPSRWAGCAPRSARWPGSSCRPQKRCSSSTSSCTSWGCVSRTLPPACTRSSTRYPATARSPRPATCRRCWCHRTAVTSSWTSRRPRRSASGRARSRPGYSRSRTAACWCCTPTGWSRRVQPISTTDSRGCAGRSDPVRPAVRWKICARPRWPGCTPTTSATTSRC